MYLSNYIRKTVWWSFVDTNVNSFGCASNITCKYNLREWSRKSIYGSQWV